MPQQKPGTDAPLFEEISVHPYYWETHGMVLKRAAEVLIQQSETTLARYKAEAAAKGESLFIPMDDHDTLLPAVSFMLLGSSIECTLKEALIHLGRGKDVEDFGHNLVRLANAVDANFSDEQNNLLAELQSFIEWRGRYPTPKRNKFDKVMYASSLWKQPKETLFQLFSDVEAVRKKAVDEYYRVYGEDYEPGPYD